MHLSSLTIAMERSCFVLMFNLIFKRDIQPLVETDDKESFINSLRKFEKGLSCNVILYKYSCYFRRFIYSSCNNQTEQWIEDCVREGVFVGTINDKSNTIIRNVHPRLHSYKSQLSGTATVETNNRRVIMTKDVSKEIRPGDGVIIRDKVYRGMTLC